MKLRRQTRVGEQQMAAKIAQLKPLLLEEKMTFDYPNKTYLIVSKKLKFKTIIVLKTAKAN